ncbi:MAG: thioredoxin family protein [Flavobacteriales bacterium]|nr:thioredoxin family protein [Flavobacteriales bacterium]
MKKLIAVVLLFVGFVGQAQFDFAPSQSAVDANQQSNVTWKTEVEKLSDKEYKLILHATVAEGWHLYSQFLPGDTALPTVFTFDGNGQLFQLKGKTEEFGIVTKVDAIFETEMGFFEHKGRFEQLIELISVDVDQITVAVEYQTCDDSRCTMDSDELVFSLSGSAPVVEQKKKVDQISLDKADALKIDIKQNDFYESSVAQLSKSSHWDLFFLGFLGGLLALLTPCVFPMIPLTVSFFTKQGGDRKKGIFNAVLYGVFIIAIYILLSIPFHFLDTLDPEILNNVSTNVWLNVFFFAIFLFFAFSFFGYYELTLPNSWGNKMDSASNIGGLIGIFFMAVTLSIVSFSCTGPILGSLLAGSLTADGGAMQLTMGMGGFGLALALPFALFALFPNLLNSLPKSGGWMTTVKVVLGFLELAFAIKFLSNADLVSHWGLLKRETFIGLWIILFAGLTLYLFGKIRFPHDNPTQRINGWRKLLGTASLVFVLYLLPGLTNTKYANLKLLSGFPPPMFYSFYTHESEIKAFKDFEEGLAFAKENNKPILLDFTGWACVNCRKMEENVWTVPEVNQLLKEEYVLISLYVDDRELLKEEEQFEFQKPNGKIKKIKTIGDKWATFQAVNFSTASQPYYVLLSPDLEMLNKPIGAVSAEKYYQWLQEGLKHKKKD